MKGDEKLSKDEAVGKIWDIIDDYEKVNGQDSGLQLLSGILKDYDLDTAANLVKANCEPFLTKNCYEDRRFDEGNEDAGFISLRSLLNDIETILNCDDYSSDIHFSNFIRLETDEEKEEEGHSLDVEWFTTDERLDIDKAIVQFEEE
jgi:hypothetical protein